MLRRKPTALTISPEDLSMFEEDHATFQRTRQTVHTQLRTLTESTGMIDVDAVLTQIQRSKGIERREARRLLLSSIQSTQLGSKTSQNQMRQTTHRTARLDGGESAAGTTLDPNDELKPLPGDKARIVRSREERIIGTTGSNSAPGSNANAAGAGAGAGAGGGGHGRGRGPARA